MNRSDDSSRAVAACLAVAAAHGLEITGARLLRDVTNVVVDLPETPVIGRVSMSLGRHRGPRWVETEIAFASHAVRRGARVGAPASALQPGPHERDGFIVSFWDRVPNDRDLPLDDAAAGRGLRDLHEAVSDFDHELPSFDRLDEVDRLLAQMSPESIGTRAELEIVRRAAALAREAVSSFAAHNRPLHGDAHLGNVLRTELGPIWSDLENVCVGPIEYDLACLVYREQVESGPPVSGTLAAYGTHDADLVERLLPVLGVFLTTWTIAIARRRPTLAAAFVPNRVEHLRELVR